MHHALCFHSFSISTAKLAKISTVNLGGQMVGYPLQETPVAPRPSQAGQHGLSMHTFVLTNMVAFMF